MPRARRQPASTQLQTQVQQEPAVMVLLFANNDVFEGKGETVIEGLNRLRVGQLKTRGEFIVRIGEKEARHYLYPLAIQRLLVNKTQQEIFQKRMLNSLR